MEDGIRKTLQHRGVGVLKTTYVVDMKLREFRNPLKSLLSDYTGNKSTLEKVNSSDSSDYTGNQSRLEKVGSSDSSNRPEVENEEVVTTDGKNHNAALHVAPFHLAILAQQYKSIKCILDYVFQCQDVDKDEKVEIIRSLYDQKILLDKKSKIESRFSRYDQSLNKMNAFHLACQFYPNAMLTFHKTFSDQQSRSSPSGVDKLLEQFKVNVNEKTDGSEKTPLHIAAKKSLTRQARYLEFNH